MSDHNPALDDAIALVHAVRGMKGVPIPENFVDPAILPAGAIRIAALDGENADPANGLTLEPGLLARSLWGEMAYRYKDENERAAAAMSEAESVAVRSTTPLNPTEEDETPNVLRARLFETVDLDALPWATMLFSVVGVPSAMNLIGVTIGVTMGVT